MQGPNNFFDILFGRSKESGIFRQIPLNMPGKLFTSPMPFGAYDKGNQLIKIFKHHSIQHVFVLVTDPELKKKAKRNLLSEYVKHGIGYSRYEIGDYQAPSLEVIRGLVCEALARLRKKQRILVHCHAGVGRTSVSVSCITMAVEEISAKEAIAHVKANMMVNITAEQIRLIEKFETILEGSKVRHFCD